MRRTFVRFLAIGLMSAALVATRAAAAEPQAKPMKPALLVIDIQNAYLPMMSAEGKDLALYVINGAMELFRENGFPVIRVYHTDLKYGPKPGSREFEYPESVMIKPDDLKVVKNYPSAFKKTDLDKILKEKGCNAVFLCGLSAVGCVISTYYGANDLDYDTFMVRDALMSPNAEYTRVIQEFCDSVGHAALKIMLENAKK
ncbi:MAG: isochorismatase family protein [Candidatus Aminicenantes bacterium]|nr:isochorismatase family protein [Candidatus Aminicenantes bacterium]